MKMTRYAQAMGMALMITSAACDPSKTADETDTSLLL